MDSATPSRLQDTSFQQDRSTDNIEPPKVIKNKVSPLPSKQNLLNVPDESNPDMISQVSGYSGLSKQLQQFGKNFGGGLSSLGGKKLRLSPSKLGAPQEASMSEAFQSKLKLVPVFSEKHELAENTFLNV